MNVWKKHYVGETVSVEGAYGDEELKEIREKAKQQALSTLKKFDISS